MRYEDIVDLVRKITWCRIDRKAPPLSREEMIGVLEAGGRLGATIWGSWAAVDVRRDHNGVFTLWCGICGGLEPTATAEEALTSAEKHLIEEENT